ncbi:uncharacterized protein [Blastocystis hominis]|uniref:Uncharacterized protein n=1 Tax=Blastocystis hominis TaxID=12968 RepID=D8LVI0_BLAHO|nr:uncharacterized protein [Blastocystis hominis]CBK19819.2 unnamed protein product [Blastocystis hominis]|eukprot:XP_012893867.1 uncharacterized protein [Blastocystis hominis]
MEIIKNDVKNKSKTGKKAKKEYMPSTNSSYYRITQGFKNLWKLTGETEEIRMRNISFYNMVTVLNW